MIFSSVEFFAMLAIVLVALRFTRNEEVRRNVLLIASYVSYGWWDWRFCFLIWTTTTIDYIAGRELERLTDERKRRVWLVSSLVANLGMLFYFKYTGFFLDTLRPLLAGVGIHVPLLHILLPVGISFFTFHSMSYTIDVYWRKLPATKNYLDFLLFVAFFPQLVAGPIVRGSQMLPQLARGREHPILGDNVRARRRAVPQGFVKKMLFARHARAAGGSRCSTHPARVRARSRRGSPCRLRGPDLLRLLRLHRHGARPRARASASSCPSTSTIPTSRRSMTEFWRRWHISLSTWLRDYLYIPLGGNRTAAAARTSTCS